MPTGKVTKASDKSQICRKVVGGLQKLYGKSLPRLDMPVLETFLFAICLEDNSWEAADAAYKKLMKSYFDLNEIRVTSVLELEEVLQPLRQADWKGLRIRSLLRYIFESTYTFEFEKYRRLTQEVAVKTLKKIADMSPFVRDFSLQHLLGSHIVCVDQSMLTASRWLGLVPLELDANGAGEHLKAGLKKSEVAEFCYLLRCLSTDPKFVQRFEDMPSESLDMSSAMDRLTELQSPPRKNSKPAAAKQKEVTTAIKPVDKKSTSQSTKPAAKATASQKKSPSTTASKSASAATKTKTAKQTPAASTKKEAKKVASKTNPASKTPQSAKALKKKK